MRHLSFAYYFCIYSAIILDLIWLTHAGNLGIAVIGSLALLYIAVFPLGSALITEHAVRVKALQIIVVFALIFVVCQVMLAILFAKLEFLYWLGLVLVYCITLYVFWRLDQRPAQPKKQF